MLSLKTLVEKVGVKSNKAFLGASENSVSQSEMARAGGDTRSDRLGWLNRQKMIRI